MYYTARCLVSVPCRPGGRLLPLITDGCGGQDSSRSAGTGDCCLISLYNYDRAYWFPANRFIVNQIRTKQNKQQPKCIEEPGSADQTDWFTWTVASMVAMLAASRCFCQVRRASVIASGYDGSNVSYCPVSL
ncbi:hypothetical protein RRG08_034146 [Elysia crispata]|uniref:Uncharacterized protein n=1 Tax=Elysia crispata TaxID=231223 RepID=A0AAE0ZKZ4_9GAST|nr:hypothetical protein RRG08_034146 [Elysia crispata]